MTIFEFLNQKDDIAIPIVSSLNRGQLNHYNKKEYIQEILLHVSLLKNCGIGKGDQVIIKAETSFRWHCFDMAIMLIGAINIPLFPTISENEFLTITSYLKPKLVISDYFTFKKIAPILNISHSENTDFNYDQMRKDCDLKDLNFQELIKNIDPEKDCCYLATSGTTGTPKLAPFSHTQLYLLLKAIRTQMRGKLTKGSKSHTSLPLSHVLGRCDSLLHLILPVQTQFGTGLDQFSEEIKKTKPNYFITIPQIIHHIKTTIERSLDEKKPWEKVILNQMIEFSCKLQRKFKNNQSLSRYESHIYNFIQNFFKRFMKGTGLEDLRFIVAGGSSVSKEDDLFFQNLGIPILKGYGLTETLGPLTISDFSEKNADSCGKPLPFTEIKIANDGEILIKSPYMMRGYLNSEIDSFSKDGFLLTGDIGEVSTSGELLITDRKKYIITTSKGRNISPQYIEASLKRSEIIENVMVTLNGNNQIVALISTHKSRFPDLVREESLTSDLRPENYQFHAPLMAAIKLEIEKVNANLAEDEKIQGFSVLPTRLTKDSTYLTPSLKLKRELIYNKFKREIDAPHTSL